ncbi:hypothetical protein [Bacillus sp. HNG]|uniref:hypothetical protein n=1 Tax=Bacillus sp. HNG TaxID=2293325 RepID=UPI00167A318F|nr:hypothetical protein [Bacillus sp. HNG]
MEDRNRDTLRYIQSKEEQLVNQLDPELDLRNINFATGENEYLNERYEDYSLDH